MSISMYAYISIYIYIDIYISLARQAAVPPPRNYTETLSIILQSTTEHLAEKPPKLRQIDPKTAPNR